MQALKSKAVKGAGAIAIATALVAAAEGLVTSTYPDVGGVPTYCYGETKGAEWGKTYTKEQCDEKLAAQLQKSNVINSFLLGWLSSTKASIPVSRLICLIRAALLWYLFRTTSASRHSVNRPSSES